MTQPAQQGSSSLAEEVYATLRADILSCRLSPGMKLKISEFAAHFSTGLAAVREALSRLSAEGLVTAEPQKGFRVAPVSAEDLIDLTKARLHVEEECVRRSVTLGSLQWEGELAAAFHQLDRTPLLDQGGQRVSDEWERLHQQFHEAVASACDSQWLLRMRRQLSEHAERYRRLSGPVDRFSRNVAVEHRALFEAAMARNPDAAAKLIVDHLSETTRILLDAERGYAEEEGKPKVAPRRAVHTARSPAGRRGRAAGAGGQ
ncbi:GntR family transcriptional regulator [Xanthobacter sp. ZOL 2024]